MRRFSWPSLFLLGFLVVACVPDIGADDLSPLCTFDSDCIDSDPCTIDECGINGHCRNTPVEDVLGDSDGDGFTCSEGDCNDEDSDIYPGASEVCDGRDNNCDGIADEGFDIDGDGVSTCQGDCDDSNPVVYPGNTETCDGYDNDCDGTCDNCPNCECCAGEEEEQPCGDCGVEIRVCSAQCSWGDYGECQQGCVPDSVETGVSCGDCGHEERICNANCTWGDWQCVGEGECSEGQQEFGVDCGNCGQPRRTCRADCTWGSWECINEGVCSPQATSTQGCLECQEKTCTSQCSWGACQNLCSSSQHCWNNQCMNETTCAGGHGWLERGGHLYFKCNYGVAQATANSRCASVGGSLAWFNTGSEFTDIRNWADFAFWFDIIQLSGQSIPGLGWDWGGQSVGSWCSGEPNDGDGIENDHENCALWNPATGYNCRLDAHCNDTIAGFVCEWP